MIESNTSIDFGLAVFNDNTNGHTQYWCNGPDGWSSPVGGFDPCPGVPWLVSGPDPDLDHGGRIVHAIIEGMTATDRLALAGPTGVVNGIVANGFTPLCESTYEAYRYLAGLPELYGAQQDDSNDPPWLGDTRIDTPNPDPRAYVSGTRTYKQPSSDCGYTYIILITDGFPTYDENANDAIEALTGETCDDYETDFFDTFGNRIPLKNCLPILTNYMATNDLDQDPENGNQFGITYTIGFATDQDLLADAATAENGYVTTNDAPELMAALRAAIGGILVTPPYSCE